MVSGYCAKNYMERGEKYYELPYSGKSEDEAK
jgi:hypothetical protein